MSIAVMKAGKYAGVEVPGAITVDECWELVKTSESTGMPCMILENVCYRRDAIAVLNMVRAGIIRRADHFNTKRRYAIGDIVTSVIKCFNGETVIVCHDTNSYRPYSLRFRMQGTKGLWMKDNDSIYIIDRSPKEHTWEPFDKYQKEFDHPLWKNKPIFALTDEY